MAAWDKSKWPAGHRDDATVCKACGRNTLNIYTRCTTCGAWMPSRERLQDPAWTSCEVCSALLKTGTRWCVHCRSKQLAPTAEKLAAENERLREALARERLEGMLKDARAEGQEMRAARAAQPAAPKKKSKKKTKQAGCCGCLLLLLAIAAISELWKWLAG